MAISRKPKADKLPISQRIDQRMENPKWRQATPTDWAIKGELFLHCSCTVFCPCVVSLGAHPPTEGHCHAWMAIAIDEGYYEKRAWRELMLACLLIYLAEWVKAIGKLRRT